MYDPSKYHKDFGSELRRRQTPELARKKRRSVLVGALLILLASGIGVVESVQAIHTGAMVTAGRVGSVKIPGAQALALSLTGLGLGALGLWHSVRGRD